MKDNESIEFAVGNYKIIKKVKGLDFLNGDEPKKIIRINN